MTTTISANTPPIDGAIRFNHTKQTLEVYYTAGWRSFMNLSPQTWVEWFDYYIQAASYIEDELLRRDYIEQEMQGRFPGSYRCERTGQSWFMMFDTPEDETAFLLRWA